jgi:fatty acid desaturase
MIIYFSVLVLSGYLAYATWGTWWSLLFFLIYGNIWGCADALWHETGHRTAFKSKFWNDFFYYIASFMDNFEPIRWRYSHFHHHTHTIFTDPLDFEIHVQKPTDLIMFFSWYVPFSGFLFFTKSLHWETLKHAFGVTTEVMKVCIPEKERSKCRWSARSHVFIWVTITLASIYFQSWLPLLFFVLPNFYGKTLISLFGLTQHAGLQENVKDHRYTTRTVILNPIFSFLYWQMEYHIEHHMFPQVPSYNLPKLHEMIKDQMPPARRGLWGAYKEIIPALVKQAKDPKYQISSAVPN